MTYFDGHPVTLYRRSFVFPYFPDQFGYTGKLSVTQVFFQGRKNFDRKVRLKLPVSISYGDDPEEAMALLLKAAEASDRVLDDPEPVARLMAFGDNGIELELRVWIQDPQEGIGNVRSDINLAIWQAFKAARITIPFPQRDIYMHQKK